jgi:L-ribulose-5-phosphate 4-epimerase
MTRNTHHDARVELAELHQQLCSAGLVVWTGGNISTRVEGGFLIKPSGVSYDELAPEHMVLCDLEGNAQNSDWAPSSDTAAHAFVYRN